MDSRQRCSLTCGPAAPQQVIPMNNADDDQWRFIENAVNRTRRALKDQEFQLALGGKIMLFTMQLDRIAVANDEYAFALNAYRPKPPIMVLSVSTLAATPYGLIGVLFASAVLLPRAQQTAPESDDIDRSRKDVVVKVKAMRDLMPASLAEYWVPMGTTDTRLEVAKLERLYLELVAKHAQAHGTSPLKSVSSELEELLGLEGGRIIPGLSASAGYVRTGIKDLLLTNPLPPRCLGAKAEYEKTLTRFVGAIPSNRGASWGNFAKAALTYVRCLMKSSGSSGPPAAPA